MMQSKAKSKNKLPNHDVIESVQLNQFHFGFAYINGMFYFLTEPNQRSYVLPAAFRALKAGFELVTRHWWLMIVPFVLDCILWAGPRLRFGELARAGQNWDRQLTTLNDAWGETFVEQLLLFVDQFNVVSALSLPLVGVPTLMWGLSPLASPLAATETQLTTGTFIFSIVVLIAAGLVIGAAYLVLMMQAVVLESGFDARDFGRRWLRVALQLGWLAFISVLIIFLISLPFSILASITALFSTGALGLMLMAGTLVTLWAVLFLSFSVPAMLTLSITPLRAVQTSARFLQRNLSQALPLLLSVFLIRNVANSLWLTADDGSWLTLFSLAGHAFVATSLVAAQFIFFHEHYQPQPDPERHALPVQ